VSGLRKREILLSILLVTAASLFLRWPALHQPLDRDLSAYATIGDRMRLGALPYRDLFDHKQPLVYVVNFALALIAPRSVPAIRLAAGVAGALTGALLYLFLVPLGRGRAAAAAALAILLGSSRWVEGVDLNTEHLMAPFACAAVLLPVARRAKADRLGPFASGLLAGGAILAKAVGALAIPAALLPILASRRGTAPPARARLLLFAAGAGLPAATVALFYASQGALSDLVYANVVHNARYLRMAPPLAFWKALDFGPVVGPLLFVALAAGAFRLARRSGDSLLTWAALLWLLGAALGAKLGRWEYPHYLAPLVAPIALLLCLPLSPPGGRSAPAPAAIRALVAAGFSIVVLADSLRAWRRTPGELAARLYGEQALIWSEEEEVSSWLRSRSASDDTLFVAHQEPGFYWLSGLAPATRYLYDPVFDPEFATTVVRELAARPPRFVVVPFPPVPPYLAVLASGLYSEPVRFGPIRVFERVPR